MIARAIFYLLYIGIQIIIVSLILYFRYRNQRFYTCQGFYASLAFCINLHDLIRIIYMLSVFADAPAFFPQAQYTLSPQVLLFAFKNAYLCVFWGGFVIQLKRLREHHFKYLRLR